MERLIAFVLIGLSLTDAGADEITKSRHRMASRFCQAVFAGERANSLPEEAPTEDKGATPYPGWESRYGFIRKEREKWGKLPPEEKVRALAAVLTERFPGLYDWNAKAEEAIANDTVKEYAAEVSKRLTEATPEQIAAQTNLRAREILRGFQTLSEVYGKKNTQERAAGYILLMGKHAFGAKASESALWPLRMDLIDSSNQNTFPGTDKDKVRQLGAENIPEMGASRPQFFQGNRGLSVFDLMGIDSTARKVSGEGAED